MVAHDDLSNIKIIADLNKQFPKDCEVDKRKILVGNKNACIFFIECMIDKTLLSESVIYPIFTNKQLLCESDNIIKTLTENVLSSAKFKTCNLEDAVNNVLAGFCVLAIDGQKEYLALPLQGWPTRAITEPPTSSVLKGPREGFVEDINVNISLLRRRLKTTDLAITNLNIGRKSQTKVALVYLRSVADKKVLKELKDRLNKIDIDGVTASYYVESLLRNNESMLFKQIGSTEKPDIAMAKILEGRIVIIVDGTPITLSVPYVFLEDLQSSDDYYMHPARATFVRIIRFFGILVAILLPGIYVAMESYHYRLLPIDFLISILSSIEGISFPPLLEVLFVIFLFEILNEASIRMPKYLGMALSIIGALILGDTAVQAGIITPPSIMIVAISGITIYILPDQAPITSLLRIMFTLIGGFAGFFGLILGFIFLTGYLVSITNFGAPLMAPFAPAIKADKKDGIIKSSLTKMVIRPISIPNNNRIRQTPRTRASARDIEEEDPSLKGKLTKRVKNANTRKNKNKDNKQNEGGTQDDK